MTIQALADLERIFAGTADAVFAVDASFRVRCANQPFLDLLNRARGEIARAPCSEVLRGVGPDGRPVCGPDCPVARRVRSRALVEHFDLGVARPGGDRAWVNVGALRPRTAWEPVVAVFFLRPIRTPVPAEPAEALPPVDELTPREHEVLRLLAGGMASRQLAAHLGISRTTVRNHIRSILAKLGVHSQAEAVACAFRRGLVPPR